MKMYTRYFILALCLLWIIIAGTVDALTRLCSQCTSKQTPTCEEKPPEATPCTESPGPVSCKIVIFKKDGKQFEFTRACASIKEGASQEKGCIESKETNVTTCYEICFKDGCNSAMSKNLVRPETILILILSCSFFAVIRNLTCS